MHCAYAIIDFIVIARYASHDMKFLKYLDHALYCIDKLKDVFKDSRSKISHKKTVDENDDDSVDLKKRHFNFSKFHVISHYKELIELYKSIEDFNIEHFEAIHKYLVKCFYQLINKKESFEIQIMQHNTWLINMLILEDMIRHQKFRKISTAKDKLQMQVIASSKHIKLNKLSCLLTSYERFCMKTTELSMKLKTWRHAMSVMKHMKINDLVNCLTVFIRKNRNKTDDFRKSDTQANTWKNDSVWAEKYFITLSTFLITWKRINKDADDLEKLKKKYVRCSSNWQSRDYWWQDHVWVQKHQDEQH